VFSNGFSGQTVFESWTLTFYNVIFTVLPPFAIGIFDQFVSARLLDRYPQLYILGQRGEFFNIRTFWAWIINGFYHSAIGYTASVFFFINDGVQANGFTSGHWVWGTTLYTAMLITVLGKAALITKYPAPSALVLGVLADGSVVPGQSGRFLLFRGHLLCLWYSCRYMPLSRHCSDSRWNIMGYYRNYTLTSCSGPPSSLSPLCV